MDNRKISEMRNLGPAVEKSLNAVGISTAEDVKSIGIEETFYRMVEGRIRQGDSPNCAHPAFLYALYGAIHDCDWREVPELNKVEFKAIAARVRKQYRKMS